MDFAALLACLGAWLFLAAVDGDRDRLVPAFVLVAFLLMAGLYSMWAEPLPARAAAPAAPVMTGSPSKFARPVRSQDDPVSRGCPPRLLPGPWRRPRDNSIATPPRRPFASWILRLLTLLLVIATLVVVLVTLHDQRTASAQELRSAKQGQAAALSSIAALVGQTLQSQHSAAVTTGELTAKVLVTRIRQAIIGLLAVLRTRRELRPRSRSPTSTCLSPTACRSCARARTITC